MDLPPTLPLLAIALLPLACGREPGSGVRSSYSVRIHEPKEGWAETIEYTTAGEFPVLVCDGVRFELRDPAVWALDWQAIGMDAIETVGSVSYRSTDSGGGALFSVNGKPVEVRDGELHWGDEVVGSVGSGSVVRVDGAGLTLE